jgi:hypothetical protein
MAIPGPNDILMPFLQILGDGKIHDSKHVEKQLEDHFKLTPAERLQTTRTGRTKFGNQLDFAKNFLTGRKDRPGLQFFRYLSGKRQLQITDLGGSLLALQPDLLNPTILNVYRETRTLPQSAFVTKDDLASSSFSSPGGEAIETSAETEADVTVSGPESLAEDVEFSFKLEDDLKKALSRDLSQLESGMVLDKTERAVPGGRSDIVARDAAGKLVVIELKRGTAGMDALGQLTRYLGHIAIQERNNDIRGILLAYDFSNDVLAALQFYRNVRLARYSFKFSFQWESRSSS